MKTALITGITGQDGAYLAKLLIEENYKVVGIIRSHHSSNLSNLSYLGILNKVLLEECDLCDLSFVIRLLEKHSPHELYNLAAQSSVGFSFSHPTSTIQYNITSVLNLLEAVRLVNNSIKFYQASSSEMFGRVENLPITLSTPMNPLSPYATSKASGHWMVINFRESYNLFACSGVLFNHESYLRPKNFFVKKIITETLEVANGNRAFLKVGHIDVKRDFGYAPLYVNAMWKMLQRDTPEDFVICSGQSVFLREIINHVFSRLGVDESKLFIDRELFRPVDIKDIYGDNTKAKQELNWSYDLDFKDVLDRLIQEEQDNQRSVK